MNRWILFLSFETIIAGTHLIFDADPTEVAIEALGAVGKRAIEEIGQSAPCAQGAPAPLRHGGATATSLVA